MALGNVLAEVLVIIRAKTDELVAALRRAPAEAKTAGEATGAAFSQGVTAGVTAAAGPMRAAHKKIVDEMATGFRRPGEDLNSFYQRLGAAQGVPVATVSAGIKQLGEAHKEAGKAAEAHAASFNQVARQGLFLRRELLAVAAVVGLVTARFAEAQKFELGVRFAERTRNLGEALGAVHAAAREEEARAQLLQGLTAPRSLLEGAYSAGALLFKQSGATIAEQSVRATGAAERLYGRFQLPQETATMEGKLLQVRLQAAALDAQKARTAPALLNIAAEEQRLQALALEQQEKAVKVKAEQAREEIESLKVSSGPLQERLASLGLERAGLTAGGPRTIMQATPRGPREITIDDRAAAGLLKSLDDEIAKQRALIDANDKKSAIAAGILALAEREQTVLRATLAVEQERTRLARNREAAELRAIPFEAQARVAERQQATQLAALSTSHAMLDAESKLAGLRESRQGTPQDTLDRLQAEQRARLELAATITGVELRALDAETAAKQRALEEHIGGAEGPARVHLEQQVTDLLADAEAKRTELTQAGVRARAALVAEGAQGQFQALQAVERADEQRFAVARAAEQAGLRDELSFIQQRMGLYAEGNERRLALEADYYTKARALRDQQEGLGAGLIGKAIEQLRREHEQATGQSPAAAGPGPVTGRRGRGVLGAGPVLAPPWEPTGNLNDIVGAVQRLRQEGLQALASGGSLRLQQEALSDTGMLRQVGQLGGAAGVLGAAAASAGQVGTGPTGAPGGFSMALGQSTEVVETWRDKLHGSENVLTSWAEKVYGSANVAISFANMLAGATEAGQGFIAMLRSAGGGGNPGLSDDNRKALMDAFGTQITDEHRATYGRR